MEFPKLMKWAKDNGHWIDDQEKDPYLIESYIAQPFDIEQLVGIGFYAYLSSRCSRDFMTDIKSIYQPKPSDLSFDFDEVEVEDQIIRELDIKNFIGVPCDDLDILFPRRRYGDVELSYFKGIFESAVEPQKIEDLSGRIRYLVEDERNYMRYRFEIHHEPILGLLNALDADGGILQNYGKAIKSRMSEYELNIT